MHLSLVSQICLSLFLLSSLPPFLLLFFSVFSPLNSYILLVIIVTVNFLVVFWHNWERNFLFVLSINNVLWYCVRIKKMRANVILIVSIIFKKGRRRQHALMGEEGRKGNSVILQWYYGPFLLSLIIIIFFYVNIRNVL